MAADEVKRSEVFSKSDGSNFTCSVSCAQRLLLGLIILKQDSVKIVEDKWKKGIWEMWREATVTSLRKMTVSEKNLELWALRWSFANSLPQILLTKRQTVKSRGSVQPQTWRFRLHSPESFGLVLTKTASLRLIQIQMHPLHKTTWPSCECACNHVDVVTSLILRGVQFYTSSPV